MASMSLKVDHDQTGSNLAGVLSKALLTDPSDAIAIEKMKSALLTDEMQRRLLREQTTGATQAAIAQAMENKRKNAVFASELDVAPDLDKLLQDQMRRDTATAVATEPPVVVESGPRVVPEHLVPLAPQVSGGRGMPEHLVPLADEEPVVVESGGRGVPESLVPLYPSTTEISGGRGLPESLVPINPSTVQTSGGRGMPEFRVPLAAPPVDAVVGGEQPLVGAAPSDPIVAGGNRPLIDLFGTGDEPVEVSPTIGDMLAGMDNPAVAGAPAAPVTLPAEATLTTPPAIVEEPPVLPPVSTLTTPATGPDRPVPVLPEVATATVPGTPPAGTVATAAAAPTLPPASSITEPAPTLPAEGKITTKAPGSVGTGTLNADGSSTILTDEGPVPLTPVETTRIAKYLALHPTELASSLGKISSILKTTYDPDITLNDNQKAELLAGQTPIGTPEEIAMKQATANLNEGIVEVDKRKYEVKLDAAGNKYLELMPGQPAAAEGNPFGTGDTAAQQKYMADLVVNKPDPSTWTPQERQNYAIMASVNFKSDVKVTDSGKIVYVGPEIPAGLLPPGATREGGGAAAAAAPAAAATAPAAAAGAAAGTNAPIPTTTEPPKNEYGRYTTKVGNLEVPNFGGYLVEGQPGKKGTTRTINGQEVTELPSDQGPDKPANEQIGKSFNFTDQALRSAAYMLNLDPSSVTPGLGERVLKDFTDGTPFESIAATYGMNENDREYFRHAMELVKDFSHRDSGADVTKSDLQTYKFLFNLNADPSAKDVINLQTSILDTLAGARTTFNGTIPSDWLRDFDLKMARLGINPDKPVKREAQVKEQ